MPTAKPMSAEVELEVPFHDVDALQIAWHGHYYKYFEAARTKLLRKLDYDVEQMAASGYSWPIIETHCKYVQPLRYGQAIRVWATVREYENRLKIRYRVEDAATREKHATGETVQVAVDLQTNEMCFVSPQALRERLGGGMTFGKVRSGTNRKTVRILLLGGVMLLGSGLTASASESVFDHPVQERAFPPTLQALGAGLQKHRTIRSQFTQTKKISILQHPLVTQGNLLYAPEHGVYWQTTSPFASEVVITPEGYFQRKKGRLVSQIPASASSGAQGYLKAFLLVFSGDFQNLQTLFSLSFLHSNQAWAVGLSSKDQLKKIIESIEISGELPAVLKLIIIRETNGDLTRIELHGINHSTAPLSPTELQFFE